MVPSQKTLAVRILEETDGHWELYNQELREKPFMTVGHNRVARKLFWRLRVQLAEDAYDVLHDAGYVGLPNGDAYIPDVAVVPIARVRELGSGRQFELYDAPLPLVVEVWSPSTGRYDLDAKLPGYQQRGDLEIWRIHPVERTLTVWRRQPDGGYTNAIYTTGVIQLAAIPNVAIDLDELLDDRTVFPGTTSN